MAKGKSDALTQATLLDLYDPDRSKEVKYRGQAGELQSSAGVYGCGEGDRRRTGIYFLSETITSPTWRRSEAGAGEVSAAKLIQWEPVNRDAAMSASKAALAAT